MAANRLSLALTAAYREGINQAQATIAAQARVAWRRIPRDQPDLDLEHGAWLDQVLPAAIAAQRRVAELSSGYLTAFLTSELDASAAGSELDLADYLGLARGGRALDAGLQSPLIGVKTALKRGDQLARALELGERRALRILWLAVDDAARSSLRDAMLLEDRVSGYRRAVRGTCGACLGAAARTYASGTRFPVHPGCQCVSEPVVDGVRDRFPRPTGAALFAAMSRDEQDDALGPQAAELVRNDEISLEDLVGTSPQETADDFITQAPTGALANGPPSGGP